MEVLENLPKQIRKALRNQESFSESLFKRPELLSSLLPYDGYTESSGVFHLKDGSFGAVFEGSLFEHETMTSGQIKDQVGNLKTWLDLPSNCVFQVLFDQNISHDVKVLEKETSKNPKAHPVSQVLFDEKLALLKEKSQRENKNPILRRRLLLSIRYFPETRTKISPKNFLKRPESILMSEVKEISKDLREFQNLIESFKHNSPMKLRQIDGAELTEILREFFNPKTVIDRGFTKFNPNYPISDQLVFSPPILNFSSITREGLKTRTLSLETPPIELYPGMMAYFLELPFPLKLSLNFKFPTQAQSKRFLDIKEFFLQNTPTAKSRMLRDDVLKALDQVAKGDRVLHLTFNILLEAETDDLLDQYSREIIHTFQNKIGCDVITETKIGCGLALSSLPLNYTPATDFSVQRYMRFHKSDAVQFLPVFDSYRGMGDFNQVFASRESNLVGLNFLKQSNNSQHAVILGDSGSGLSTLVRDSIQSFKRESPDSLIFILDSNSSHLIFSEFFDGDVTVFDRTKDMPFSPLRGVYDEGKVGFLTNFLITAVRLTSQSLQIESEHYEALSKSIRLAYNRKIRELGLEYKDGALIKNETTLAPELKMEDIVSELSSLPGQASFENLRKYCEELTQKLRPFYGDGFYSKYFKGTQKEYQDTKFFLYDLESLSSDPTLQTLMTMAVIDEIVRIINLPENQGKGGIVLIEKLGLLGKENPEASRFVVQSAERFKTLNLSLLALASRPADLFETEAGKAMWSIADFYLFMQMGKDNLQYLEKNSKLFNEADLQIIGSLITKRGEYADIYFTDKKGERKGAFRFFPTVLDKNLCPVDEKSRRDVSKILRKFSDDKSQALRSLRGMLGTSSNTTGNSQNKEVFETHP